MSDLIVIIPSRGRPAAAVDLVHSLHETCRAQTSVLFGLDSDDPLVGDYVKALTPFRNFGVRCDWRIGSRAGLVGTLNRLAVEVSLAHPPFALGFMGDDHRPRTIGWDAAYLHALEEMGTGIVYGNDLLQGSNLPTQVALTDDIVLALDYMVPPVLKHMYADNFWRDLGANAGCLKYLPEVIVEHLHPAAGKADWDDNYERVNALLGSDAEAYTAYRESGEFDADLRMVQDLMRGKH